MAAILAHALFGPPKSERTGERSQRAATYPNTEDRVTLRPSQSQPRHSHSVQKPKSVGRPSPRARATVTTSADWQEGHRVPREVTLVMSTMSADPRPGRIAPP